MWKIQEEIHLHRLVVYDWQRVDVTQNSSLLDVVYETPVRNLMKIR
jgi:hypothetical protein